MIADLRLALRSLSRARLTSLVATLALGLGIGATVTVFSVFDAVWLEPLPYDEPDRLVALRLRNTHGQETGMSYPNFVDLRDRASSFETLSAFNLAELNVIRDGRPELTDAHQVLGDIFGLIGVEAAIGRGLVPSDDARDAPPVIVLAHDYWMTRFGADPDVVGTTVTVEGASYRNVPRTTYTIVGVMAPGAWFRHRIDAWIPFQLTEEERNDRSGHTAWLIGRLGDGVEVETAASEVRTLFAELKQDYPAENSGLRIELQPEHASHYGDDRRTIALLLFAASLLLLIACGNVAHLVFARVSEREREICLRSALGAGRLRILRLLGCESLILMVAGGLTGLLVARFGIDLATSFLPRPLLSELPQGADAVVLNGRVLALALVAAVSASTLSSLVPVLSAVRADLVRGL